MRCSGLMSQAAVARELGVSRMRVIQLERSGLEKLSRAIGAPSPYERVLYGNGRRRYAKLRKKPR